MMYKKTYYLLLTILLSTLKITAQEKPISSLYKTIIQQDSLLFSVGFNQCNIQQYEKSLSDQLQFYHDKDGISDKQKFLNDLKNGLCKNPEMRQVKRLLLKDKTEIYPLLKNDTIYGAVHNGDHLFYESKDHQPGIAKFTNIWLLENNEWKLNSSISYNHQPYTPKKPEGELQNLIIAKLLDDYKIPALGVATINNGKIEETKVFENSKNTNKYSDDTIFNVASLTKPITAFLTLELISQGKWTLDKSLSKYWIDPDITKDSRNKKITTRQILSHQTGFPNWRWMKPYHRLNFDFDPGTKYQYSGEGFEYLRKAIEIKFNNSIENLAQEYLFKPLKMNNTSYVWKDQDETSKLAIGYDKDMKPYKQYINKKSNAADDVHTNLHDYATFLNAILNQKHLNQDIYNEMVKKQVKTKANKYFGLGFEIYDLGNGEIALAHGGSDEGSQFIFFLLPKTKQGLIIFTNSDNGNKTYEKILDYFWGEKGRKIVEIETK